MNSTDCLYTLLAGITALARTEGDRDAHDALCYRALELRSRDPLSRRLVDGGEVATATMDLIGLPVRSPLVAM